MLSHLNAFEVQIITEQMDFAEEAPYKIIIVNKTTTIIILQIRTIVTDFNSHSVEDVLITTEVVVLIETLTISEINQHLTLVITDI